MFHSKRNPASKGLQPAWSQARQQRYGVPRGAFLRKVLALALHRPPHRKGAESGIYSIPSTLSLLPLLELPWQPEFTLDAKTTTKTTMKTSPSVQRERAQGQAGAQNKDYPFLPQSSSKKGNPGNLGIRARPRQRVEVC